MTESIWHHPQSVAQALKLLNSHGNQAVVVGGATTMALRKDKLPTHIIDLGNCGLDFVRSSAGGVSVGAMTRLSDIIPQSIPGVGGAFMAHVASHTATTPLRNMITLGGNLAQCYAWSEMPIVMLAMDATINLKSENSRRRIKASKFYTTTGKVIRKDELISHVEFPVYNDGEATFGYEQIRRTVTDYPILSVAVFIEQKDQIITNARIVVGSAKPRPLFCAAASAELTGQNIKSVDLDAVAALAVKDIHIANDVRASIEYKQEMVPVLCRRALSKALAKLA